MRILPLFILLVACEVPAPLCEPAETVPVMHRGCVAVRGRFRIATPDCEPDPNVYSCRSTTSTDYYSGEYSLDEQVSDVYGCQLCDGQSSQLADK